MDRPQGNKILHNFVNGKSGLTMGFLGRLQLCFSICATAEKTVYLSSQEVSELLGMKIASFFSSFFLRSLMLTPPW